MKLLLEHDNTPGMVYESCLIIGDSSGSILNEMVDLNEAADMSVRQLKFKGKLQEAERPNKNRRIYPKPVLESSLKNISEALKNGGLIGELDHPENSIVHFATASHKFTKIWWEGNVLMGEGFVLNTPYGRLLRNLINDGVRVGMSSRGVGNGKVNENGLLVIGEGYKLVTFDAVADPSTFAAYQKKVKSENENMGYDEPLLANVEENTTKVESTNINIPVRKEVLIAALGGLITQKTNRYLRG